MRKKKPRKRTILKATEKKEIAVLPMLEDEEWAAFVAAHPGDWVVSPDEENEEEEDNVVALKVFIPEKLWRERK